MNEAEEGTGVSRLVEAAAHGCVDLCKQLILVGENINMMDDLGWTPLMQAIRSSHCDLAESLLSLGADACLTNQHGVTVFTMAVLSCDKVMLQKLCDCLPPELRQTESNNALQVACEAGLVHTVSWLLSNTAAQVNLVSEVTGVTALELAVIGNHSSVVELLLQYGAQSNVSNSLGLSLLELAKTKSDKHIFSILQRHDELAIYPTICFDFEKTKHHKIEQDPIDSCYTTNKLILDVNGGIVLKNSPSRPVFKTKNDYYVDLKVDDEMELLLSSSLRSVFLPSPQLCSTPVSQSFKRNSHSTSEYHPCALVFESPMQPKKTGKKRKLSNSIGCSSWLKKFTKRRTKSLEDSGDFIDYDTLRNSVIDFNQLLSSLGLDEFYKIFKKQELDMWTFLSLTVEDLITMGITEEISQEKILKSVETLRKTQF